MEYVLSTSSFARILMILDLFSVQRPVIDVDDICTELDVSKPMAYRYLKELVEVGLLKKAHHQVGSYVLGSKVALLDYVARESDPWVQLCIPQMREVVNRTEMLCLITALEGKSCIDIHHESYRNEGLVYGRGCPRALSAGSSAKIILANLTKNSKSNIINILLRIWQRMVLLKMRQNLSVNSDKSRSKAITSRKASCIPSFPVFLCLCAIPQKKHHGRSLYWHRLIVLNLLIRRKLWKCSSAVQC